MIFQDFLPNKDVLEIISTSKNVITATKLYEGQPRLLCEASSLHTISIFPLWGMEDFPEDYIYKFEQFNYLDLVKKINLLANEDKRINSEEKYLTTQKNIK